MRTFQIITLALFAAFAMAGLAAFSLQDGGDSTGPQPVNFTIWGELPEESFESYLATSAIADNDIISVEYEEIESEDLYQEVVQALAHGNNPDVLLMSHDKLMQFKDFLFALPYTSFPPRQFQDSFVGATEIYLMESGVYGFPLAIDPIVMYWNRDMLANSGFVMPPAEWDDLPEYAQRLTVRDNAGNISQSAIAFGGAYNTRHTKDILSVLLLQAGTPITSIVRENLTSTLSDSFEYRVPPANSALSLYTQYANPANALYSWNNSFGSDLDEFVSGDLALYFGPATESQEIRLRNPNLNFDVAPVPQRANTDQISTFGHVYAFSILQNSPDDKKAQIFEALVQLTNTESSKAVAEGTDLAPVRRDVLAGGALDTYKSVFFDAAVTAQTWIDPNPSVSEGVFRDMVLEVTSGQYPVDRAVSRADAALRALTETLQ